MRLSACSVLSYCACLLSAVCSLAALGVVYDVMWPFAVGPQQAGKHPSGGWPELRQSTHEQLEKVDRTYPINQATVGIECQQT